MHQRAQENTGYAFQSGEIAAQADYLTQRPVEACATSYNGHSRLKNRSNGTVLPTITEQCSNLTLSACGSLLGSRNLSLSDAVGHSSLRLPLLRALRGSKSHMSYQDPESVVQERHRFAIADTNKKQIENRAIEAPTHDSAMIMTSVSSHCSQLPNGLTNNTSLNIDSRNLRGFVRGVFRNVQSIILTESRSFSAAQSSFAEHQESCSHTTDQNQPEAWEANEMGNDEFDISFRRRRSSLSVASSPMLERQSTNRNTSTADTEHSAHTYPSTSDFPVPPDLKPKTNSKSENRLSPRLTSTPSREQPSSVRLVQLEPRDTAYKDGTAGARGHSDDTRDHTAGRDTFYATSVSCNNAPSLTSSDGRRETSPNTSFCGTVSTYTGTVLGIDLDLHRNFGPPIRHSRSVSPPAIVRAELQPAKLERPVSVSEESETEQSSLEQPPYRSITSSALTSLLPIATASGIVRPNYNTPKISFYSPSGNLIEPEGSVISDASASDLCSARTALIPSSSESIPPNHNVLYATTCLPPSRPSLVPMTTPPTSLAPLPPHLKYHHNYRKPERSQINPSNTFVVLSSTVMGCGGVVKPNSPFPQNVLQSTAHRKSSPRSLNQSFQYTTSKIRHLASQAANYQNRLITATATFCTPSGVPKKTCKQHTPSLNTGTHARVSLKPSMDTVASGKDSGRKCHTRDWKDKQDTGLRSALPGYALRICFCQPHDGAGESTHAVASEASCLIVNSASAPEHGDGMLLCSTDVADIDSAEHLMARTVNHIKKEKNNARVSMA